MRVVVTGASGFVGRNVVRLLTAQNFEVVPVSRRPLDGMFQVQNYADAPGGDVLIHLAEDRDRARVNDASDLDVQASTRRLSLLLKKNYKSVVYASSAVLYGDEFDTPRKPGDPLCTSERYAEVKSINEEVVLATGKGMVARLANVYGLGMAANNVLSAILNQIPGEGELQVHDEQPVRDFVWVEDVAEVLVQMAVYDASAQNKAGVYNVGSGVGVSIGDLARLALDIAGEKQRLVVSTKPTARVSSLVLDLLKTETVWGWKPHIGLRSGIKILLDNKRDIKATYD